MLESSRYRITTPTQLAMQILAMQFVTRNPIGPPTDCWYNLPPNLYVCVLKIHGQPRLPVPPGNP